IIRSLRLRAGMAHGHPQQHGGSPMTGFAQWHKVFLLEAKKLGEDALPLPGPPRGRFLSKRIYDLSIGEKAAALTLGGQTAGFRPAVRTCYFLSTMPELPEVETTRRGIAPTVEGQELQQLLIRNHQFRWPIPEDLPARVNGRQVLDTGRRGKYLWLNFDHGAMIIHLGMSGSIRHVHPDEPPRKHDHVDWIFPRGTLRLHDPRRFGSVLWHAHQ